MADTNLLTTKLLEIINQVQAGIIAKAPAAMSLILASIQVDAIGDFMICVGLAIFVFIAWKLFLKLKKMKDANDDWDCIFIPYNVFAGIIVMVCGGVIIFTILNIWEYVAIVNPKLYLAHEIINKLTFVRS